MACRDTIGLFLARYEVPASQSLVHAGPNTTAWTHNFLNQKPWHPLNFRNQIKRWEAEQAVVAKEKSEASAKAEFEAEQQYLETLAHLPSKEADKYRHMQGMSPRHPIPPYLLCL